MNTITVKHEYDTTEIIIAQEPAVMVIVIDIIIITMIITILITVTYVIIHIVSC